MSKALVISIDIISDTICPWCFIGKRRLESAIEQFRKSSPDTTFDVIWHPFYLGPPDGPVANKLERYTQKFGAARVQQMLPYMQQTGLAAGIKFDYGGPIGPTFLSHRVISYVQKHEKKKTDDTVNALFHAYFENQGNIFTKPTLLQILHEAKVDLDYAALEKFMDAKDARKEVDAEIFEGQRKGVSGVPDFTIRGRYNLNGAQEPEAFLKIFNEIHSENP